MRESIMNTLVWENGFSQVVCSLTRGDALLDVYLVRPESSFTSSSIVQGISDHHGVILEVEWEENVLCTSGRKFSPRLPQNMIYAYKTSFGENMDHEQAMVVAWRKYGIISRK
jgi:hypothetical protein